MKNENEFIKSMPTALNLLAKEVFSDTKKHFTFWGIPKTNEAKLYNHLRMGLQCARFTVWRCHVSNEIKITKG